MKKRILSLLLVVVMLALTLTGCSYSFAKDDMSTYVDFDEAAFKAALEKLVIEDGTFTTDEETRKQKIEETIRNTIAQSADLTDKKTTGEVGAYDILYYAYYATADFEVKDKDGKVTSTDKDVILYASNMKESSAVKLQLGMNTTAGDLEKAIMNALKGKDIKDSIYATDASTATSLKKGDVIYVSYSFNYLENGTTETVKATYERKPLGDDEFSKAIIEQCKTVGAKKDFKITVDGVERSYTGVVADWVVKSENKLGDFEVKDFDKTKSVTDISDKSRKLADVKDGVITYHVYPVYYVPTDDFTATIVLDKLLGQQIYSDLFDLFKDEKYKATVNGEEKTLAALIDDLAELCYNRDNAKTSLSSAESTLSTKESALASAGDGATEAQKTAVDEAKKARDEAKKAYDDAEAKVAAQIKTILGIDKELETKLLDEYREMTKKTLINDYHKTINLNLAKEIWTLIDTMVTVKDYPAKAIDEMYERILDEYEYTFNTGKDSTTKVSYYKKHNGSFKAYLIATLANGKTYEDALEVIRKSAKEAVEPIIKIYAVSEVFDCVVSDKEFKQEYIKGNSSYESSVEYYGETNIRTAYQFQTLLDSILEYETDDKGEMKDYVNGKIPFKYVKYEIKPEEDKKDESKNTEG